MSFVAKFGDSKILKRLRINTVDWRWNSVPKTIQCSTQVPNSTIIFSVKGKISDFNFLLTDQALKPRPCRLFLFSPSSFARLPAYLR